MRVDYFLKEDDMKKSVITLGFILTIQMISVSCSHQAPAKTPERDVASKTCMENIRPEYHSYFDSVEKCMEKE